MKSSLLSTWKQEPVSPGSSEESWVSEDTALYWTTTEQNDFKVQDDIATCESKAEVASKLLEGLDRLEDLDEWIKEEPFSNWLEEKMLPIFDDVEQECISSPTAIKIGAMKSASIPDTQSLLQEFETVLGAVELTHGTLTPPQSPPYEPLLTKLETLVTPTIYIHEKEGTYQPVDVKHNFSPLSYSKATPLQIEYPPATPQPDLAHELAVVDELVRTRVEDMVYYPSSPGSSSSNFEDCSSDDPEWIPETIESPTENNVTIKSSRKRSKPYSRPNVEDKKSRKKEQNKNAATRYRLKKKAEVEEVLGEERVLATKNDVLETNISDLEREIKYLKGLMRDLFKAKGLIN